MADNQNSLANDLNAILTGGQSEAAPSVPMLSLVPMLAATVAATVETPSAEFPFGNEPHLPGVLGSFLGPDMHDAASTYLAQHPMWEPYMSDLHDEDDQAGPVTIDGEPMRDVLARLRSFLAAGNVQAASILAERIENGDVAIRRGQDLADTIRKCAVRWRALDGASNGVKANDGKACHVAGMWFRTPTNVARLEALDVVAAAFGGVKECGRATCYWGSLADPTIALTIALPDALSAVLCVDGIVRTVRFTFRDALDGTTQLEPFVTVHNARSGSAIVLRSLTPQVKMTHKHTKGGLLVGSKVREFADKLPMRIAEHAEGLQRLASTVLSRGELAKLALLIANDGKEPKADAETGEEKITKAVQSTADQIVGMVLAVVDAGDKADDRYVPKSLVPGEINALQLFEAACAFDRHYRTIRKTGIVQNDAVVRTNRVLDRDTYGDTAWSTLIGYERPRIATFSDADGSYTGDIHEGDTPMEGTHVENDADRARIAAQRAS